MPVSNLLFLLTSISVVPLIPQSSSPVKRITVNWPKPRLQSHRFSHVSDQIQPNCKALLALSHSRLLLHLTAINTAQVLTHQRSSFLSTHLHTSPPVLQRSHPSSTNSFTDIYSALFICQVPTILISAQNIRRCSANKK